MPPKTNNGMTKSLQFQ